MYTLTTKELRSNMEEFITRLMNGESVTIKYKSIELNVQAEDSLAKRNAKLIKLFDQYKSKPKSKKISKAKNIKEVREILDDGYIGKWDK